MGTDNNEAMKKYQGLLKLFADRHVLGGLLLDEVMWSKVHFLNVTDDLEFWTMIFCAVRHPQHKMAQSGLVHSIT
jgi:hypothetical protein